MKVYDPLRGKWVAATPEEVVRQKWIEVMLNHLSFPKELLIVEKKLPLLPHLEFSTKLPNRRIDILAYQKVEEKLLPLLLVECKQTELTQKALLQAYGYNDFISASYVAIANEDKILLGYKKTSQDFEIIDFLPSYSLLIKALR